VTVTVPVTVGRWSSDQRARFRFRFR
jgi:hypothetical protein